jgi:arginyl-tRNA synthetase
MTAGGPGSAGRLWLAAATATALRAGLDLLGVDAPDRL